MESRIQDFKQFHGITKNIDQQFKLDNGLFVMHNDRWIRLTKNDGSFYAKSSLKQHGRKFMRDVGLMTKYQPPSMEQIKSEMMHEYTRKESLDFVQTPYTIGNFLKGYELNVPSNHKTEKDISVFLGEIKPKIQQVLIKELGILGGLKFQLGLKVQMHKDEEVHDNPTFYNKQIPITNKNEIEFDNAFSEMENQIDKWTKNGSNWVIDRVETLWINIAQYQPLRGGSYIDLPAALKNKKAIINVQNKDDNCLRWALRSALFPVGDHVERTSKYPVDDGLNFEGISAPTPINQIIKVEKQNNLAINVFGWKGCVIVHQLSKQPSQIPRINLMLIEKEEENELRVHYVWIKNLNKLLFDQTKYEGRKYFCERCLHGYSRADLLEKHKPECKGNGDRAIRIEMPKKSILEFENWHKQMKAPFVIYADFESIIKKIEGPVLDPTESNTQKTQIHEVCGFSYIVVRSDRQVKKPVLYRGPDATEKFLQFLGEEEEMIKEFCKNPKPICMTEEDWKVFNNTTNCYICHKVMGMKESKKKEGEKYLDKVRDHCHLTGKFRGAAHYGCNFKLRLNPDTLIIPVVFHNLRGYDSHLIMQAISKTEGNIKCIPNNMEKYISFSLRQLRFIDSAQFLLASLDKLVKASKDFDITNIFEPDLTRQQLLLRKGVYPYEYMDSWERFDETHLPPIESFYSSLTDESISEKDYEHAQNVWKAFQCKNIGDYHDLYLRTDVLLLADIFENFRTTCLRQYELDPAHYYTSPGLSWDALLKKTGVKLELLTDYDMFLFVERGLRGGISQSSKRYAKANNSLVPDFDPTKPTSYIMYLDANNLYGWAMSQSLPTSNFRWLSTSNLTEADYKAIINIPPDYETGCILEVDLEYPKELHDMHNDYPLAPESIEVQDEWLSPYQRGLLGKTKLQKIKKLVPNLMDKTKYIVHYRNLQLYLSLGMRLKKIHRILAFDQSPWMEPYIRMNTELRKKATNDFEKDLYKLMNNSVFGKTMENLRKRVDVKLVRSHEDIKIKKLTAKPSFARQKIFDNDLAGLHMYKDRLVLNRPIYVGMSILDISKILMYEFYYDLKKQYGGDISLNYTDTDSLIFEIRTPDFYQNMAKQIDLYDTSDFPKDHYLHSLKNKKVLGKMKDECAGQPIFECVCLRPKMYSILKSEGNIKKAKGVKKNVVKKQIIHDNYKEALFNQIVFRHGMNTLRSMNHQLYGLHINKYSLSPLDTKRWIKEDGINTLAFGHYEIQS